MQHTDASADDGGSMLAARDPFPTRLDADELHPRVIDEGAEDADRVRATADARDHDVRKAPKALEALLPRFATDHRLDVTHHRRVRVRSEERRVGKE